MLKLQVGPKHPVAIVAAVDEFECADRGVAGPDYTGTLIHICGSFVGAGQVDISGEVTIVQGIGGELGAVAGGARHSVPA